MAFPPSVAGGLPKALPARSETSEGMGYLTNAATFAPFRLAKRIILKTSP